ncbi:hypothetical protein [Guptibacillus algicola]|uniref:hypothetical protein n=1 Tax=Guptibacillus algicola TaxID=225844 RepID=UPI001CD21F2A|nr:hypothetical protein [Alkalihalobacillus algicola]MCA0987228.1 hypothetical protein [Alkalihalobacillus algicola]
MSIATYSKFARFKESIYSLPEHPVEEDLIHEDFLLERVEQKKLEVYYAPFEHVNENAKVVIVGITPGLHQMKKSFETVRNMRDETKEDNAILKQVKNNSSFEGPMRKNLVNMLDELNVHHYLGLSSTIELFGSASHLVQTTSILPYPVFRDGKNYSGATPQILKTPLLRSYALENFPTELSKLSNPLIIPLGVNVSRVLSYLSDNGYISSCSVLTGFPHPSGANGNRVKQFEEYKESMKKTIELYFR